MEKKQKDTKIPSPVSKMVTTEQTETKSAKYVVIREGYRVSDKEYDMPNDPSAISEKEFWTRVAKKHSYGEPVEIVQYDAKKHRVWADAKE